MRLKRFKNHEGSVSEYHLGPWRIWRDEFGKWFADMPMQRNSTIGNLIGQIEQGTQTLQEARRKD